MQEQLDRIERMVKVLYDGRAGQGHPMKVDDDAPDPVQPVMGFDRVFGPKPHPSESTNGTVWRNEARKVTKVYQAVPGAYVAGAIELAARTGVKAVFLEYLGSTKACVRPGLPPNLWLVDATNFLGSNIEGLIRSVLDSK